MRLRALPDVPYRPPSHFARLINQTAQDIEIDSFSSFSISALLLDALYQRLLKLVKNCLRALKEYIISVFPRLACTR